MPDPEPWKSLAELERGATFVTVERVAGMNPILGFPLQVDKNWAVIAQVHGAVPWGFAAVRCQDVQDVRRSPDNFVRKALKANGEWPINRPAWHLNHRSAGALVQSIADIFGTLTLSLELVQPDECYVGVPVRVSKKRVDLLDLSPNAKWKGIRSWNLDDVTLIEFGDPYAHRLTQVAGPAPEWSEAGS